MNPVFIVLVAIGCILLVVALSPLFTKIGDAITRKWNKTFNIKDEEDEEDEE